MITDEQLDLLYDKHSNKYGEQSIPEWYAFCHELIALAQQVKPLEFEPCNLQSSSLPLAYLGAKSAFGRYLIHKYKNSDGTFHFFTCPNHVGSDNGTEAEAIEAANEDYQRRVLSCLVWGGGE